MEREIRLTDGVVTLRRYLPGDRERLVELADNPNVSRFLADRFPCPYTLADAEEWLKIVAAEVRPCNFAIEWRDEFVDGIGLEPMGDVYAGTSGLGYWLGEPYWGKGLATRAFALLVDYAFEELLFIRLQSLVYDGNPASMHVLEKCGFVREGVMRAHVRKCGVVHDAVLYARLRRDGLGREQHRNSGKA